MKLAIKQTTLRRSIRPRALQEPAATIPVDSLDQYMDPKETRLSLERALADAKRGRVHTTL